MAVGCMFGGHSDVEVAEVLRHIPGWSASEENGRATAAAHWLHRLYPPEDELEYIGRIKPDLVLEQFATTVLSDSEGLLNAFGAATSGQLQRALGLLIRAAAHHPDAPVILSRALSIKPEVLVPAATRYAAAFAPDWRVDKCLAEVVGVAPLPVATLRYLLTIVRERHQQSLPLLAVALQSAAAREAYADGDTLSAGTELVALGGDLNSAGRHDDARDVFGEAVRMLRSLSAEEPGACHDLLADALRGLGESLDLSGRWNEAVPILHEALAMYRTAIDADDEGLGRIGETLLTLSGALAQLDRYDEALSAAEEAVELYRSHGVHRLFSLAVALRRKGNALVEMGRFEEGVEVFNESILLHRLFSIGDAEGNRTDLAVVLDNLSVAQAKLENYNNAVTASEESVGLWRLAARGNPRAHEPDLANALMNLGATLQELVRNEAASRVAHEAALIYRRLSRTNSRSFLRPLANTLLLQARAQCALTRFPEAEAAASEAVGYYRQLAEAYQGAYTGLLAGMLNDVGVIFAEMHLRSKSKSFFLEAVNLIRPLAEADPANYANTLIAAEKNLATSTRTTEA